MAKKWYAYLFRENIYGLGIQAATFIAGILFTVIFPNLLGRDGFGYLSLVIGVVSIALGPADFGASLAVLKLIPEGVKAGIAWKYLRVLSGAKVLLTILVSVLLFLGADLLAASYHSPALAGGLRVGAVFLFFYSFLGFIDNVFVALKKTRNSLLMDIVFHGGRIALPLALFFYYAKDYVTSLWGIAGACAIAVMLAAVALMADPHLGRKRRGAIDRAALWNYMFYGFVAFVAYSFISWSDTLVVGLFRPVSDVSLYRVAWLWATATAFLFPFSQRIFLTAHAYEDEARSRKLFDRTLKYSFVFSFLMMAGIVLVAAQFLNFIYRGNFDDAYPVMVVLSILTLETALNILNGGLFQGKGDVRTPTMLSVATVIAQVALLFIVTPAYGLMGAALAVVSVRILMALLQTALALRFISLRIPAAYVYRPALCAVLAAALLLPLRAYTFNLPAAFAYGIALVALYAVFAVVLKAVDLKEILGTVRGAI